MQTAPRTMAQSRPFPHCTLSDLPPGAFAYIAPSALLLTPRRRCLLRTDVPTRSTPDAAFSLHVRRTESGYVADITGCTHQWIATDQWDEARCVPVEHLVFADEFLR